MPKRLSKNRQDGRQNCCVSTLYAKATRFSDHSQHTKLKKQKHKRHTQSKEELEDMDSDTSIDVSFEDGIDAKPAFKVRIRMTRDSPSTSAADLLKVHSQKPVADTRKLAVSSSSNTSPKVGLKKKKGRGRDSGTSSEEERWLDAIESGKLEEVDDELKKIKPKDPKMMTARQRAMYERGTDREISPSREVLLALPSGYKEKVMTAEAIQKAALKSQKRKQLADEKREKDKKKTMERLLKKQESKSGKAGIKGKPKKQEPMTTYINNNNGITLSFPPGTDFPLEAKSPLEPPKIVICGVQNCINKKIYSCSKTGVPLCSLECYKRNLQDNELTTQ